jgi:hypothetical protein
VAGEVRHARADRDQATSVWTHRRCRRYMSTANDRIASDQATSVWTHRRCRFVFVVL